MIKNFNFRDFYCFYLLKNRETLFTFIFAFWRFFAQKKFKNLIFDNFFLLSELLTSITIHTVCHTLFIVSKLGISPNVTYPTLLTQNQILSFPKPKSTMMPPWTSPKMVRYWSPWYHQTYQPPQSSASMALPKAAKADYMPSTAWNLHLSAFHYRRRPSIWWLASPPDPDPCPVQACHRQIATWWRRFFALKCLGNCMPMQVFQMKSHLREENFCCVVICILVSRIRRTWTVFVGSLLQDREWFTPPILAC